MRAIDGRPDFQGQLPDEASDAQCLRQVAARGRQPDDIRAWRGQHQRGELDEVARRDPALDGDPAERRSTGGLRQTDIGRARRRSKREDQRESSGRPFETVAHRERLTSSADNARGGAEAAAAGWCTGTRGWLSLRQ